MADVALPFLQECFMKHTARHLS